MHLSQSNLNKQNTLLYIPSINRFADDEWCIIHDLYRLFNAWQLDLFKKNKKDISIVAKDGVTWCLYYLNEFEEDEVLDFISWNESFDFKMDKEGI